MTATESAVIVALPEAENAVSRWRAKLDQAAAWGVPAHITLIYPFLPPAQINAAVLARLGRAINSTPAFDVTLARIEWFGTSVVWLSPQPAEPFRSLISAVWQEFPETPPYSGAYPEPIPHLTIGDGGSEVELREAADAVEVALPIHARVQSAVLICGSREPDSWRIAATLPVGS